MWAPGHFGSDVNVCDWCGLIIGNNNTMSPFAEKIIQKSDEENV